MMLQDLIGTLNEAQLKKGGLVSLRSDANSSTGVTIPRGTVVEVLSLDKKGNKTLIVLLSPDDEIIEMEINNIKEFPHKIVK